MKDAPRRLLASRPTPAGRLKIIGAIGGLYLFAFGISVWLFLTDRALPAFLVLGVVIVAGFILSATVLMLAERWNIDPRGGYRDRDSEVAVRYSFGTDQAPGSPSLRGSFGFVALFSALIVASVLLVNVAVWASVLLGVAALAVFVRRVVHGIQVGRRARATGTRPDPTDFKRRLRAMAVLILVSGVLAAIGMAITFVTEPDNPDLPVWLVVAAPLLLILAAGYVWWVAGLMERLLRRSANNDPNPDESG
jgi:hypothetical protein